MNILDFDEDAIVLIPFSTNAQDGGAIGPSNSFEVADFVIYQDTFNTGKETTDGMFVSTNWAGITGLHMLLINTAVDAGNVDFAWEAGSIYTVCIRPDETVDGQTVVKWIGSFRLGYVAGALTSAIVAALAGRTLYGSLTVAPGGKAVLLEKAAYTSATGQRLPFPLPSNAPDATGADTCVMHILGSDGEPFVTLTGPISGTVGTQTGYIAITTATDLASLTKGEDYRYRTYANYSGDLLPIAASTIKRID